MTSRLPTLFAMVVAIVALTACTAEPTPAVDAAPVVLSVLPDGTGDCTAAHPCGFETALARASSNTRIEFGTGDYGSLEISGNGRFAEFAVPLVLTTAPDAAPVIDRLRISAPAVHLVDLTVRGLTAFDPGADGGRAERLHVTGSGMFVRADHVRIIDSLFEGGSSVDGLQIAGASDVVVEGSTVRDYDQEVDNGRHADCIQLFDIADVVLRGNRLANCYNAGIIISGGGRGIQGLLVEANYVQGCVVKTERCGGGSAAEFREQAVDGLVVRNNTFLDGSVRWGSAPGAVFDRNIVGYLSECGSRITRSLVLAWNQKMCAEPAWLGADGNRTGTLEVRDRAAGDLAPLNADEVRIDAAARPDAPITGIDGETIPDDVAGAAAP
ncbi:right-handed parallel beta-helix repeat-containing protein [Protaetiibacter intestinalis]|uniref:Right handed beta helix domain-containing protein n=1 Tax=Protaetiibacter intestinalis TaxID=2419774 RepID=A0A387BK66_9MICO|nr:right-handed parallel beta-helix repeat-containing protein [Protaetiibacter intestinalis]AYF98920.1 hypothetical protein D7I47_12085 [Protaetiibacter intestinalis]